MRFGVLVSGRGSNLAALLSAESRGLLAPGSVELVISNRPGATAIAIAAAAGKPTAIVDHTRFADRTEFEGAIATELDAHRIDAILLAGFMRVLTARFVDGVGRPIVNTHPSLLPAFPGVHAAAQAVAYGAKLTGVTVHFVDGGVDTGPIIAQRSVAILPDDDAESLHRRIQVVEHQLFPAVARALAQGRVTCRGRHVAIAPRPDADQLV